MVDIRLLHDVLKEGARARPNKVAVRMRAASMSYAELEAFSNRIARCLSEQGIGPGARVGVYLAKSLDAVTALLGVLKAGAACVPLDIESPLERLRYIVSDCDLAALIVADGRVLRLLQEDTGAAGETRDLALQNCSWRILQLGSARVDLSQVPPGWSWTARTCIEKLSPEPVVNGLATSDLAYILYTSGSTGQPKGVMLSHGNTRVFVDWAVGYLELREDDIFSSHAPFHFDLSILDIYACLAVGGTLCLIPPGISYFAEALADFVEKQRITVWYSVPSALVQILVHPRRPIDKCRSIRALIYAGEVFPFRHVNELRKALPEMTLYNFYGPTETNVITAYTTTPHAPPFERDVPIGTPCTFANVRVLDAEGHPVTRGALGELVVNGDSLMQGYWRDPDKTARTIRPVALNGRTELMYFTGDIVKELADGALVYVSRRDNMVKTRGFRVELGEVEAVLDRHPKVRKSAVIALPDERIGHRLLACLMLEGGKAALGEVEAYCATALSAYMVPERLYFLENLPLTSTGKIDRDKLRRDCEDLTHG